MSMQGSPVAALLFWAPRLLAVAYAVFLSLFALDVFQAPVRSWQEILALLLHLAPAIVVLGILALSWRRSWVGAFVYPLLAVVHLAVGWGRLHWIAFAVIGGPLVLVGILFLLDANVNAPVRR
jgi:hypothetical protein